MMQKGEICDKLCFLIEGKIISSIKTNQEITLMEFNRG